MQKIKKIIVEKGREVEVWTKKATSSKEEAPKRKYVRNLILRSHTVKSCLEYFRELTTRPLLEKVIAAYKSLTTLHFILVEGHQQSLIDSYNQRTFFKKVENCWSLKKFAYAQLVTKYTDYLYDKVLFHHKHPEIIHTIEGSFDLNKFQNVKGNMTEYEMMDLMNQSLDIQTKLLTYSKYIIKALGMDQRTNTLGTNDCISSTIIPLVYDSFSFYSLMVYLFKKLHEEDNSQEVKSLIEDALKRFYTLYEVLRKFYNTASTIRYVTSLCTVPVLPEEPPTFDAVVKKKKRVNKLPEVKKEEEFDFVWHESALPTQPSSPRRQEMDYLLNAFQNLNSNNNDPNKTNFTFTNTGGFVDPSSFNQFSFNQGTNNVTGSETLHSSGSNVMQNDNVNRNQQLSEEEQKQIDEIKNMILKEREQAKNAFNSKDQTIQNLLLQCKQVTDENDELQRQLDALLKENEMLRMLIRKAKENHNEAVKTLIENLINDARSRLDKSIQNFDNPTKSGNTQSSGKLIRQNKEELSKILENISKQDPRNNVGLLLAVKNIVNNSQDFLNNTKGAVQSNNRSNTTDSILNLSRKFASHLNKFLPNFLSGDSNLIGGAVNTLSQFLNEVDKIDQLFIEEEEKNTVSKEDILQLHEKASHHINNLLNDIQTNCNNLNNETVSKNFSGEKEIVANAIKDAAVSTSQATKSMLEGLLNLMQQMAKQDQERNKFYLRDKLWLEKLMELMGQLNNRVSSFLNTAQDVIADKQPIDSLSTSSSLLKNSVLDILSHVTSLTGQSGVDLKMKKGYEEVSNAIDLLIKAVEEFKSFSKQQEKMQSISVNHEDRSHIIEQRALIWRLRNQIEADQNHLKDLEKNVKHNPLSNVVNPNTKN